MEFRLLVINPGSTSTKISIFDNEKELFEKSRFHDAPVLLQYPHVNEAQTAQHMSTHFPTHCVSCTLW